MKVIAKRDFYNHGKIELEGDHPYALANRPEIAERVVPMGAIFKIGGDLNQKELAKKDGDAHALLVKLAAADCIQAATDANGDLVPEAKAIIAESKRLQKRRADVARAALPTVPQLLEQIRTLQTQVAALAKPPTPASA